MILVVSFPDNAHVDRVLTFVQRDVEVVDLASFPTRLAVDVRLGGEHDGLGWLDGTGRRVDVREIGAVWRRRLRSYDLDDTLVDPTARLFARSETDEAVAGLLQSTSCRWMNDPAADEAGQRKTHQLNVAQRCGLRIPDTLVTNDPASALAFIDAHGPGEVVCKAFRNIAQAPRWTRRVTAEDRERVDGVRFAPVIFQEFVPGRCDLRITIVGEEMFAASIVSDPGFDADYRPGLRTAIVEAYDLPGEVGSGLRQLMDELGLVYGAVDLRVTPEGEHMFFEVNPGGEFLFVTDRTGQPVPQAIAAWLDGQDKDHAASA